MRLSPILIGLLFFSCLVSGASYEFEVDSAGKTTAFVHISQQETIRLPSDVGNPEILDGTYVLLADGIEVIPDEGTTALLAYESSFHTKKEDGIWTFNASVHNSSFTTLVLPEEVQVIKADPRAAITKIDGTLLEWGTSDTQTYTVTYISLNPASGSLIKQRNKKPVSPVLLIGVFVILLIAAVFYRVLIKGTGGKGEAAGIVDQAPDITEGQMNIIRAANPNDQKVITVLLSHQGHIKRNQLEKETAISKSSLAACLSTLEKKNILTVDRSFHIHYVALTDWFKSL